MARVKTRDFYFSKAWIARWLFVAKVGICRRKVARFPARLATGV